MPPKGVSIMQVTREKLRNSTKKRSLCGINEHFDGYISMLIKLKVISLILF